MLGTSIGRPNRPRVPSCLLPRSPRPWSAWLAWQEETVTTTSRRAGRRLAMIATQGAVACGLVLPGVAVAATAASPHTGLGPPNTWVATGPMGVARSGQTATLLADGKVLVAGGGTASAELYDPTTRE